MEKWDKEIWVKLTVAEADALIRHSLFSAVEQDDLAKKYRKKKLYGIAGSYTMEGMVLMQAREKLRKRLFGRKKWFKEQSIRI
jgi:molecular chaperone DnaK (HSP70)